MAPLRFLKALKKYCKRFSRFETDTKTGIHLFGPIETQEKSKVTFGEFIIQLLKETSRKHDIYMTGSFPLCLLVNGKGEAWNHHEIDIDLFVSSPEAAEEVGELLLHSGLYEKKRTFDNYLEIFTVYRFSGNRVPTIDIVEVVGQSVETFVNEMFDLDFCKILFDGTKLIILDIESLEEKRSVYKKPPHIVFPVDYRIRRYRNRGFRVLTAVPEVPKPAESEEKS